MYAESNVTSCICHKLGICTLTDPSAEEVRHPRVKGNVLHTHSLGVKVQSNVECVYVCGCRTSSDPSVGDVIIRLHHPLLIEQLIDYITHSWIGQCANSKLVTDTGCHVTHLIHSMPTFVLSLSYTLGMIY